MGKKHATSTSTVTIPPEVLARYNAVNKRAEEAAAAPFQKYGTKASDFVAQMNAQQNAGIADINATSGSYKPYMDAANTATMAGMGPAYAGIDKYMSPYIKNVADATGAMMRQQQEQAQSGALGTAAMSGAFGGDRAGIAAANLQQQNAMGYGKTMADIMNQGYTQALGASQADLVRQLQGGSQLAGLGAQEQQLGLQGAQAKIAAGTMQQQTEQAGKDALIKQFMQEKAYPFQVAQYLANIAMGTGALSGSTTTSTQPAGIFSGIFATGGRVGGYADGGGVVGPMSDSQQPMWAEGYVPGGVLPVGQLMTAEVPATEKKDNTDALMKLAAIAMGAKRGGTIDARHGYATDGAVRDERLLVDDVPAPQTLGSLPEASVRPAMSNEQLTGLAGAAIDRATTGVAPNTGSDMRSAAANFARKYNVPEELFLKLVGQESSFNPEARSDAGAIGLAQLMPGTARELGVDPNEPMQNLEGGAKYLRQMYDRFGSWDRALAAYNGGPGRLSSAVDRATALGGSYLDYMPEETQNYVGELTGVGASGDRGGQSDGSNENAGLAGGLRLTHDKPYSERTAVGKMFYNPDGTVNKDAILSILSGVGTMASSNSRYLLPALLQGIGGAASTYAELEAKRPDILEKRIKNANEFEIAYQKQLELNPGMTRTDFAQAIGYQDPIPYTGNAAAPQGAIGAPDGYKGVKFTIFGNDMSKTIPSDNGTLIPAGMDYGYLKNKENWLKAKAGLGWPEAEKALLVVQDQIEKIENNYGQITAPDGSSMTSPGYAETKFGAGRTGMDIKLTEGITEGMNTAIQARKDFEHRTDEMYDALKSLPVTGTLAPVFAEIGSALQGIGLTETSDTATARDVIAKNVAKEAIDAMSGIPGATDYARELSVAANPDVKITPEAAERIIATRMAAAEYQNDLQRQYDADPSGNLSKVQRDFALEHSLDEYFKEAYAKVKGTLGREGSAGGADVTADSAPDGSTAVDGQGRAIIKRNGKWVLQ